MPSGLAEGGGSDVPWSPILSGAGTLIGGPLGGIAGNLLGGILGGIGGHKQNKAAEEQMKWMKDQYAANLQYNRPDQINPFGSVKWSKDPNTGAWTQTGALSESGQKRLDAFNQMAENRMNMAKGIDLSRYAKGIDYNALGMGALNKAAGGEGTTGARTYAQNPYAFNSGSMGGALLNGNLMQNFNQAQQYGQQPQQTPGIAQYLGR